MSSGAAKSAADTQAAAANHAADLQMQQYQQTRNDLAPYRDFGQGAAFKLANIFGLESQAQQNGGGGSPAPAPAGSPGVSQPQPQAGWNIQPFGGVAGDGSYEQIITDPNGNTYYRAYDRGNNVVATYDASGNPVNGLDLAMLTSAAPAAVPLAPPSSSGAGGSTALGTGSPNMGILQSYGLSGLTFNPADYGLGNGTFQPTEAQLQSMPGYQFTLDQGLKSTQNGYAARGLGSSGAAMKGAAQYATGLADTTVGTEANIFNNNLRNAQGIFQTNLGNVLNPLMSFMGAGQNAANQTGTFGSNAVTSANNATMGGAASQAAGQIGSANALSGGLNSIANSGMNYLLMNRLLGSGTDTGTF
jgi:hypothetical protein